MKKVIYKDRDIEITLREVLVSVAIFLILSGIGCFICESIDNNSTLKKYKSAQIVNDDKQMMNYLINTKYGNMMVYSTFKTDSENDVSFDELEGNYSYITKIKEEYNRHTRKVCTTDNEGKRNCTTEVYYSWDYEDKEKKCANNIDFLGYKFNGSNLLKNINSNRLTLSEEIYKGDYKKIQGNYVYTDSETRYYYKYIPLEFKATLFFDTRKEDLLNQYELYYENNPGQVIESKKSNILIVKAVFIVVWLIVTGLAIYGYVYLDNNYLEG